MNQTTDMTDIATVLRKVDACHEPEEANALMTAAALEIARLRSPWRPIETAPKDGTVIWAVLRCDLHTKGRDDLEWWSGVQVPLKHPGLAEDGFDVGWNVAAPVGVGGFPDAWIAGWIPLPEPLPALTAPE